jgi:hypothetical protein
LIISVNDRMVERVKRVRNVERVAIVKGVMD